MDHTNSLPGQTGIDAEAQQTAAVNRIHERARYLRGRFLNFVAVIEREIAAILTDYFCTPDPVKRELFFKHVVTSPSFSLRAKKELLFRIVQTNYPEYWAENREVLGRLDDIMQFRNRLAHSVVDLSDSALARPIESGVGFVDWNRGEPITDEQFQEWEVAAAMIGSWLEEIQRLLPFRIAGIHVRKLAP
jgi:hypothetical protein